MMRRLSRVSLWILSLSVTGPEPASAGNAAQDSGTANKASAPSNAPTHASSAAGMVKPSAAQPVPLQQPCQGQLLGKRPTDRVAATEKRPAMKPIPPGGFMMGEGAEPNQLRTDPVHPVCITHGFLMMETEVTIGQFFRVVQGHDEDLRDMLQGEERCVNNDVGACVRVRRTVDSPMSEVNLFAVLKYANFLSVSEGLSPCYRGNAQQIIWENGLDCTGYRLPTEAEWEYAARAGQNTLYAGSDNADEVSWHASNSRRQAHPVKSPPMRSNAWGLYDMSGNVMEWVWDFHAPYQASTSPLVDPLGPQSGEERSVRGGSFINPPQPIAWRGFHGLPQMDAPYIGFRLVRSYR